MDSTATRSSPSSPDVHSILASSPRIANLDVLRGLALVGMFIVHFVDNIAVAPQNGAERHIRQFSALFLSDRFHTMFAILFGIGFAIQLQRADASRRPFVARYLRRMAALAGFGIIAELMFNFQILFGYALWGCTLLLVRRWSIVALMALAVLVGVSRPIYAIARAAYYTPALSAQQFVSLEQAASKTESARFAAMGRALRSPHWHEALRARVWRMQFYVPRPFLPPNDVLYFLLGVVALRLGLFERPDTRKGILLGLLMFGIASWALATWGFPRMAPRPLPAASHSYAPTVLANAAMRGFNLIRVQWLTFSYMAGVLLLDAYRARLFVHLSPLAWAGRMALTNYMLQVAVLCTLFSPSALGLHVHLLAAPIFGILLFSAQSAFSYWWLQRYAYGPLEWVWRSITYWKIQPLSQGQNGRMEVATAQAGA